MRCADRGYAGFAVVWAFAGFGCGGTTGRAPTIADAGPSMMTPEAEAAPLACHAAGTWSLTQSVVACGDCPASAEAVSVGLVIASAIALAGGAVTDTSGYSWQLSAATCSATTSGTCNSSATDTIDFASGQAVCVVTCADGCVTCPTPCVLRFESP